MGLPSRDSPQRYGRVVNNKSKQVLRHKCRKMTFQSTGSESKLLGDRIRLCDGGLSSTLVQNGFEVDGDPLWGSRVLYTNPKAVLHVHEAFVAAGADILISNSYQASVEGFVKHLNVKPDDAMALISRSVELAQEAAKTVRRSILIAGSVGPYGAFQNDGSEYTGAHIPSMSETSIMDWHRPRMKALVEAGVDLLAVETLPALKEAIAIIKLLREFPNTSAWISFSCQDGERTHAKDHLGRSFECCYNVANGSIVGFGINCTEPEHITSLLESINESVGLPPASIIPRVVYPNTGEDWIPGIGWMPGAADDGRGVLSWDIPKWMSLGAQVIGGCCRVSPDDISKIARVVKNLPQEGDEEIDVVHLD